MWTICLALAEPIARAFASAFGQALVDMVAAWRSDRAISEAATAKQALAASEAARGAERAMREAADRPVSDAELLDALDRGRGMTPVCLGMELMLLGARLCLGGEVPKPTPPVAVIACPELEAWSAEEQHALAVELRAHPTPVTIEAAKRLQRARAQIRACLKSQNK